MSSEDSKEVSGSVPSIISPDLKIVGDLKCTSDIQIDGTIEGSVTGGLIIIGEQAKVEGTIVAETVRIFGTVNGRVRAKTVHLDKTGKVIGDTGVCLREIGRMMGRSASTISRELARNSLPRSGPHCSVQASALVADRALEPAAFLRLRPP